MPGAGYSPGQNFDATKPAGATELQDADNDITDNQKHQDNAYAVEHYAPSDDPDASEDDFGRHDYISLKEQETKPDLSGSAIRHALYAKDDGLYIENVDGTETKIFDLVDNSPGMIYHGRVDSDGSALRLPTDWTSARSDVGRYTVTHNLGTANYTIIASIATCLITNHVIRAASIGAGANSFAVNTWHWHTSNDDEYDLPFDFILIMD